MKPGPDSIPPDLVRDQVARGRTVRLRVLGTSMLPLVPPGATLSIGPLPRGGPRTWDIVAIELRGRTVCHVVTSVRRDGPEVVVGTRGLSNTWPDPPSRGVHLLGLVTGVGAGGLTVPTRTRSFGLLLRAAGVVGPVLGWGLVLARRAAGRLLRRSGASGLFSPRDQDQGPL